MEKSKKVKITLGLFYLLVVSSFLYFFLSKFTLEELTSYEFIKNNRDYFFGLKQTNLFLLSVIFLIAHNCMGVNGWLWFSPVALTCRILFLVNGWNYYFSNWNDLLVQQFYTFLEIIF